MCSMLLSLFFVGGDWAWFGGRMVQALISYGLTEDARRVLKPMTDRVIAHNGFFEWWDKNGKVRGYFLVFVQLFEKHGT
eukprot:SAG31_NODE_7707_length_1612_cov_1.502974_1_plen_79_part_00